MQKGMGRQMSFKFKQQSVGETTYLTFEIDDNLEVDSFAMHMMTNNRFANIVQTQIVRINEKRQIQFNVTGLTKMNSRISMPRPKREVLGIFSSILNAFEEVDAYMLDMDHLFLEWEYVYLDGQGNCMLMYLPFDHTYSKDKIDFLQEVVSRVQPDYQEKDTYLFDIQNSFSRGAIQKLSDFREIIKKCANVSDVGGREEKQQTQENRMEVSAKPQEKETDAEKAEVKAVGKKTGKKFADSPKKSVVSRLPVSNIPGREPGTRPEPPVSVPEPSVSLHEPSVSLQEPVKKEPSKNFSKAKKEAGKGEKKILGMILKKQKHKENDMDAVGEIRKQFPFSKPESDHTENGQGMHLGYEPTLMIRDTVVQGDNGATVMLKQPEFATEPSAKLIRRKDGTEYRIDRDRVAVGSGTAVDIRIPNGAISRSHAVISRKGSDYYIEDTQSSNGTFIGGRRIEEGVRESLYDGMLLKLANEDFEFVKD